MNGKPTVWEMVKEAITALNGRASATELKEHIRKKYDEVNDNTLNAHLVSLSVNDSNRIHFTQNKKPRATPSKYDILFTVDRGVYELYDPARHGRWEIVQDPTGKLRVVATEGTQACAVAAEAVPEEPAGQSTDSSSFALESHLRDYIAHNLTTIEPTLKLYVDESGRDGVEYPTDVGPIDILAVDKEGNFTVLELKLSRGPDRAMGQLARYMGWVKRNKSKTGKVSGIIVAHEMDEKLKYAASISPDIRLFEYELQFKVKSTELD